MLGPFVSFTSSFGKGLWEAHQASSTECRAGEHGDSMAYGDQQTVQRDVDGNTCFPRGLFKVLSQYKRGKEGHFLGFGGRGRVNQIKEFSESIEGDLSVERCVLMQYFKKNYNSSLHSFKAYSTSIGVLSTSYILRIN